MSPATFLSANTCTHTTTHATRQYPHQRQSKTINTSLLLSLPPPTLLHPPRLPITPRPQKCALAQAHTPPQLAAAKSPCRAITTRAGHTTRAAPAVPGDPHPATALHWAQDVVCRSGQRHVARTNACAATSAERRANGTARAAFALRARCRATRLRRRALFPNSLSPRGGNVPLADALRLTLAPCVPACCLLSACARAAQRYVLSCPSLSHPPPCAALAHQAVQARARLSSAAGHIVLCAACLAKGVQVDSDSDGGGVAGHGRTTLLPHMQWSGTATRRRTQAGGYLLAGGASVGLGRGHHEPAADADTGNRGRHTHARTRQVRRMRTRER